MKIIPLIHNQKVMVDDEDFTNLSKYTWWYDPRSHCARTTIYIDSHSSKKVLMHRMIMNPSKNKEVDHVNGNRLDNRKSNLRICNRQENSFNQRLRKDNTSGFKGVSYIRTENRQKRWIAYINVNKKRKVIGRFYTAEEGAHAYDRMALRNFGEYAKLNFN